ncbi:hypothetical protein LAZ67_19001449, partial [Cordylochernes scorpioides]
MVILTPTTGLWLAHRDRHAGVWLGTGGVKSTTIGQWLDTGKECLSPYLTSSVLFGVTYPVILGLSATGTGDPQSEAMNNQENLQSDSEYSDCQTSPAKRLPDALNSDSTTLYYYSADSLNELSSDTPECNSPDLGETLQPDSLQESPTKNHTNTTLNSSSEPFIPLNLPPLKPPSLISLASKMGTSTPISQKPKTLPVKSSLPNSSTATSSLPADVPPVNPPSVSPIPPAAPPSVSPIPPPITPPSVSPLPPQAAPPSVSPMPPPQQAAAPSVSPIPPQAAPPSLSPIPPQAAVTPIPPQAAVSPMPPQKAQSGSPKPPQAAISPKPAEESLSSTAAADELVSLITAGSKQVACSCHEFPPSLDPALRLIPMALEDPKHRFILLQVLLSIDVIIVMGLELGIEEEDEMPLEIESDIDEYDEEAEVDYHSQPLRMQLRQENPVLPETVTVLTTEHGGKVYLVGTAHFSAKSQDDVTAADLDDIEDNLKQAIDILKEKVNKSHQSGNAMFFKEAIEGIPEFDGSTVPIKKWLQEIDDNAILFGWTDLHTLVVAKKLLTGVAKLWLRSQPTFSTWPDLKEAITNEFDNPIDSRNIHILLTKRKKKQFESYYEYFLKMRELGSQGNLEEAVIIQYVIDGIPDQEFNKSILYGSTSYSDFKIKLKNYEMIKSKSNTNSTTSKVIPKPIDDKESKCFNCGKRGHLSRECRFKDLGKKCFSCSSFGHIANQCPTRSNANTLVKQVQTKPHDEKQNYLAETTQKGRMFKYIKINDHELQALIDTGSQLNLIRIDRYLAIGSPSFDADDRFISGIGNKRVKLLGKFKAEVKIDDVLFVTIFNIVPEDSMKVEVIIGDEMLKEVHFSVVGDNIQIKPIQDDWIGQIGNVFHTESCPLDLSHITDPQLAKDILSIQKNYNPKEIKTTSIETKIILKTEVPLYQHPRRLSQKEAQEVDAQIDEWLKQGIIQKSNSEYASPIVLVKKKNGKTRICVDYRKLNKETVKDRYPLPLIEDQIDKLQAARLFSTIDLKNGFFHIPVAEDSRKLTSFVVPNGQYEFLKTPFGLCNAPAKFQRFINSIFAEEIQKGIVLTYLDDIVIPANDAEEALKRLKHVLKRAEEYELQINWEKCQILKSEITYLGHEIKDGVIRPSDDKVTAVKRFPELKTIKQLQSFLGLTGYFRKFIKNYSIIAKPLSDMLKTNFMMGPDQKQAFQDLKQILTSKPILKIYQVGARTELHTDASKFGFGAILLQEDVDQKMHPVHYMSKKTNEAQQKYSSYELEVLAVVEAVKKFRIYLLGIKFKILTDCSAFTMTLKKKDLTTRVARWALLLEEYDYTIEHRPGSGMKHVDALSRNPVSMMIQTDTHTLVEKIRNAQGRDPLIKALLVIVKEKQVYDGYFEENNLLWKEVEGDRTLVIPKGMEIEIIKLAHEEGHFGVQKNFEMLKKEYYITDLKSKIKKYIQNCIPCILSNRKHGKQEGMLHPISKGDTPLDTYHIDHLGPLASTRKDYNYLLVITDGFTKFTWIYPTKTTRTSEVIQKLESQQQIFGNPRRIITDQGTAFTSNDFKEYCKEESIEHCCITTGVPRGNGQVERINRTIVSVLTKLSIDNPQEWHKHVRKLQKALNSTHQRSIRMSPFELLVGVKMRKEEDLRLLEMIEEDLALTFDEERDQKRKAAKQEILKIQEENRNTFNKKRKKAFVYKEGDLVVIQKTQFATKSKLYPKYIGPYKVIKIKPNDRYNVEKFADFEGPNRTSCSADLMKPWFTQDEYPSELSEADEVQDGRILKLFNVLYKDAVQTIRATQPDVVVVELCKNRVSLLSMDKNTILEEAKSLTFNRMCTIINQSGVKQGMLYLLLLSVSAHMTRQLGMAPGGEFRQACEEAKKVPGCLVQLGDRPIHLTLRRVLAYLSLWQKVKLAWYLLTCKYDISAEDVEKCKQKDLLEQLLAELAGVFPKLSEVLVAERDLYLAYSLRLACSRIGGTFASDDGIDQSPQRVVVGVVGMGHVAGIVANWDQVTEEQIKKILEIWSEGAKNPRNSTEHQTAAEDNPVLHDGSGGLGLLPHVAGLHHGLLQVPGHLPGRCSCQGIHFHAEALICCLCNIGSPPSLLFILIEDLKIKVWSK